MPGVPEQRGRKRKITDDQLCKMDDLLKSEGFEARSLSWQAMAWECGITGLSDRTISRAMGKLYIARKRGERYCNDCIQRREEKDQHDKEIKKVHAWAAVGYNFKSDLVFYEIESNKNSKMTQQAYIGQILEPHVKRWLDRGDYFTLEEDGDSGHGPGKGKNIVKTWKEQHHLQYFFNCHSSPDLAPIENCWQPSKKYHASKA
ncbi:hypothetical protein BU25DRAFT_423761 [Macroventuria anomochaeta]|uniref:Uncharacterized protein n=1 Tax=Macroventuria anomochaeta TaxID=301207 RepID=A0ACB6RSR6_9PLEO|nr:uncharacterized protein BU25DRAFT_423761 [Macroventuria anomochaeta]KAF2625025.1 hypothetical protein BU25DRAFT_423761 [Macroventuria anomochaeta]